LISQFIVIIYDDIYRHLLPKTASGLYIIITHCQCKRTLSVTVISIVNSKWRQHSYAGKNSYPTVHYCKRLNCLIDCLNNHSTGKFIIHHSSSTSMAENAN